MTCPSSFEGMQIPCHDLSLYFREIWVLICESHFPILLNRKCQLFSCSTFSEQLGEKIQAKLMVYFSLPLNGRYNLFSPSWSPRCVTLSGFWEETLSSQSHSIFENICGNLLQFQLWNSIGTDYKDHRTFFQVGKDLERWTDLTFWGKGRLDDIIRHSEQIYRKNFQRQSLYHIPRKVAPVSDYSCKL